MSLTTRCRVTSHQKVHWLCKQRIALTSRSIRSFTVHSPQPLFALFSVMLLRIAPRYKHIWWM